MTETRIDYRNDFFKKFTQVLIKNKIITTKFEPQDIIFNIINSSKKKKSKIFFDSALLMDPNVIERLIENNEVQTIKKKNGDYYSLTYKGISKCIEDRYRLDYQRQYQNLLEQLDKDFINISKQKPMNDKEKLSSLSLLLLNSVSEASAIRLKSTTNQTVLNNFLKELIVILKKYKIISEKYKLPNPSRNESASSALMARLDRLPIITNHLYTNIKTDSGYYYNVVKNNKIDENSIKFLLHQIFKQYNPHDIDTNKLKNELFEISNKYNLKFIDREVNSRISYTMMKIINNYLDLDIYIKT
ncbi:MAG: hypothetical protein ACTSPI_07160 [Candidatus Heimdallarchaeaceae archaeon]